MLMPWATNYLQRPTSHNRFSLLRRCLSRSLFPETPCPLPISRGLLPLLKTNRELLHSARISSNLFPSERGGWDGGSWCAPLRADESARELGAGLLNCGWTGRTEEAGRNAVWEHLFGSHSSAEDPAVAVRFLWHPLAAEPVPGASEYLFTFTDIDT